MGEYAELAYFNNAAFLGGLKMERQIKRKDEKELNDDSRKTGFRNLQNKGVLITVNLKTPLNTGMSDIDLMRITDDYLFLVEEKHFWTEKAEKQIELLKKFLLYPKPTLLILTQNPISITDTEQKTIPMEFSKVIGTYDNTANGFNRFIAEKHGGLTLSQLYGFIGIDTIFDLWREFLGIEE